MQCDPDGLLVNQKTLAGRVEISGLRLSVRFPGGKMQRADGQPWRILPCGVVLPATVRLEDGRNGWRPILIRLPATSRRSVTRFSRA